MKWKVERAGSEGHWLPGWIAYTLGGKGASFATWAEAFAFADRQARAHAQTAMRGAWKAMSTTHEPDRSHRTSIAPPEPAMARRTPSHGFGALS